MTDDVVWGGGAWMGVLVQDVSFGASAAGVSLFFFFFFVILSRWGVCCQVCKRCGDCHAF